MSSDAEQGQDNLDSPSYKLEGDLRNAKATLEEMTKLGNVAGAEEAAARVKAIKAMIALREGAERELES